MCLWRLRCNFCIHLQYQLNSDRPIAQLYADLLAQQIKGSIRNSSVWSVSTCKPKWWWVFHNAINESKNGAKFLKWKVFGAKAAVGQFNFIADVESQKTFHAQRLNRKTDIFVFIAIQTGKMFAHGTRRCGHVWATLDELAFIYALNIDQIVILGHIIVSSHQRKPI